MLFILRRSDPRNGAPVVLYILRRSEPFVWCGESQDLSKKGWSLRSTNPSSVLYTLTRSEPLTKRLCSISCEDLSPLYRAKAKIS